VSQQATEAALADGRPLIRGEYVNLSREEAEDDHNNRLIADGQLLPTTTTGEKLAEQAKEEQD
jgi:hypothetical protein